MKRILGIVCLGIALLAGYACSQDSANTTPTAPEVAAVSTSGMQNTFAAAATKIYICHGNKSEPYGVVVEVGDEYYKRHVKHLDKGLDCICQYDSIAGEPCSVTNGGGYSCYNSYDCPSY